MSRCLLMTRAPHAPDSEVFLTSPGSPASLCSADAYVCQAERRTSSSSSERAPHLFHMDAEMLAFSDASISLASRPIALLLSPAPDRRQRTP
eukprot:767396-Hanusia_phi.AAC.1